MLNEPAPLVIAIQAAADRAAGTSWETTMAAVKILVTVGALAGLSSVMVVMMLAQPRIFLSMSKDGLLPAWAGKIHPRFHTPHVSTLVTGASRCGRRRPDADRHPRQPREHWHLAGVRDRLDRDHRAAADSA